MIVLLNGKSVELPANSKLSAVLGLLNVPHGGVALAVNNRVVPKDKWGDHVLNENDKVLLIKASQGG